MTDEYIFVKFTKDDFDEEAYFVYKRATRLNIYKGRGTRALLS